MFKNAVFGKAYKTRDGRCALCISKCMNTCRLYVNGAGEYYYNVDGSHKCYGEFNPKKAYDNLDIVSEWRDEIDESELDVLAEKYVEKEFDGIVLGDDYAMMEMSRIKRIFKEGYRKGKGF